ncbi:MAG: hypothetical protein Q4E47_02465 [Candidatus Saccharibacteria bacterium]|nr:hypothetical protein [Candidatus Saccharibacteria bacterium]
MQGLTNFAASKSTSISFDDLDSLMSVSSSASSAIQGIVIWTIVATILSVIGGILIYFLFVKKTDLKLNNKFLVWLKSFLNSDKMYIEDFVKIAYIASTLAITLTSFNLIAVNFWMFLLQFVGAGIIGTRVAFEAAMMAIKVWHNTTDMKKALCKEEKKEEKKAKK